MTKLRNHHSSSGFSLIEVTIALAIIGVMIVIMSMGTNLNIFRGYDAVRKSDFGRLKISFEDYYNDHECYPPPELLDRCGSSDMAPYLGSVPCDPKTKLPYEYARDASCKWYAVFTTLQDESDPVVKKLDCFPTCRLGSTDYNYVITNGGIPLSSILDVLNENEDYGPVPPPHVPTPTPVPEYGPFACDPFGICNSYADPAAHLCPATFFDAQECQEACADLDKRCKG